MQSFLFVQLQGSPSVKMFIHLDELLEGLESCDAGVVGQPEDLDGAVVGAERDNVLPGGVECQAAPARRLELKMTVSQYV